MGSSDLYAGPWNESSPEEQGGILPFLVTCRRLYAEAIDVLYSHNNFSMLHLESVLYLSYTTLPQRFNAIRSLHLSWSFYIPYSLYMPAAGDSNAAPYDEITWE